MSDGVQTGTIKTEIPARMDRLPWASWHWMVVIGLGTVWILDGLEVTIVGTVSGVLIDPKTLALTAGEIGNAASVYVLGAVCGAIFFGHLTDRLGRKKLFIVTLVVYLVATVLTAFSFNALSFFVFRFFTGAGIGGEYAAINSAIDELIPARFRGRVDLIINGSFWVGAAAGGALALVVLNEAIFSINVGWRLAFGLGAILGLGVLVIRRNVPESPRWLFVHGQEDEADKVVGDIERQVKESTGREELDEPEESITIRQRKTIGIGEITRTIFRLYPKRAFVCLSLFAGQAFIYNAIFFTYALVLTAFYKVPAASAPIYIIPFAIGNFLGPLLLGKFFDTVGRRKMIAGTYIISGVLLIITGYMFTLGVFSSLTITLAWCIIFFFASAGASAAYLTVSEIFPLETRALAIAVFYAIGTGLGGIIGPSLFGKLVESGKESSLFFGYALGGIVMILGGIVEAWIGIDAEQRSLENIAKPLTAEDAEPQAA